MNLSPYRIRFQACIYFSSPCVGFRDIKSRTPNGCGLDDQMNDSAGKLDSRSPPVKIEMMAYFEAAINSTSNTR